SRRGRLPGGGARERGSQHDARLEGPADVRGAFGAGAVQARSHAQGPAPHLGGGTRARHRAAPADAGRGLLRASVGGGPRRGRLRRGLHGPRLRAGEAPQQSARRRLEPRQVPVGPGRSIARCGSCSPWRRSRCHRHSDNNESTLALREPSLLLAADRLLRRRGLPPEPGLWLRSVSLGTVLGTPLTLPTLLLSLLLFNAG